MTRAVVIGAGMAGILAAIKLREAGFDDVAVYEKAERLGGTWRENTYPGISCDVPSHLYSYSFAPNPEWSHVFSPGEEICGYLEGVAKKCGVSDAIRYGCEIDELAYREGLADRGGRWQLSAGGAVVDEADVVVAATGVLHHPSYPDITGLDSFAGACFHSSRWDHTVPIEGARVGVIGTGSEHAVQIVGAIVDTVGELALFQRTAQWILPVGNRPIGDEDRETYRSDPATMAGLRRELSKTFTENFADAVVDADSPQMHMLQAACTANLEENIHDPELRELLRPDYRAACKRLVISSTFYPALERPNARLVTAGIDRVTRSGVRTVDGVDHPLDVLVLATGFRVDRFLRPMSVVGREGVSLDDVWAQRPSAYLAVTIPNFPNLFMLNGPNGPVGNFSLIDVAEMQMGYILKLIDNGAQCARAEAAARFEAERVEAAKRTVWVTGCKSWYLDDRGVPAAWPWGFARFHDAMTNPRWEDLEISPAPV